MNNRDRRSEWTVLVGVGLVALGAWLLVARFFGWLAGPIAVVFATLARLGWPLLLIGIGILLVLRARGGGWNPVGGPILRSRSERMISGVLGGAAAWLRVSPTAVRVVYVFATIFTGFWPGVILYILATIFLPEESYAVGAQAPAGGWGPTPQPPGTPSAAPTPPPAAATPEPSAVPSAYPETLPVEPPMPPAPPASASEAPAAPSAPPIPAEPTAPPTS